MKAWELEKNFETSAREKFWRELNVALSSLKFSDPETQRRWNKLPQHLKPGLSLREFQNLILPWERLIEQSPEDSDFMITSADQDLSKVTRTTFPLEIALDHWRSAFNVGSVFRTADALGIQKIHLLGYTTTPGEKFLHKTALGTENIVAWEHHPDTAEALKKWKKQDYHLVAFETALSATPLDHEFPRRKTIFVLGNERFGLSPQTLSSCHETRQLPLVGTKNSLNAAVMMALATYEWKKQWSR